MQSTERSVGPTIVDGIAPHGEATHSIAVMPAVIFLFHFRPKNLMSSPKII